MTALMAKYKTVNIIIKPESNDLIVKWDNGAILEKFCLSSTEDEYHIYDYLNNKTYDVCSNKIRKRLMNSKLRLTSRST